MQLKWEDIYFSGYNIHQNPSDTCCISDLVVTEVGLMLEGAKRHSFLAVFRLSA